MSIYLGIDIGTSGTKTLAIRENGRIVASATFEYPLSSPRPGWSEQDPEDWWRASARSVRKVLKDGKIKPASVAGIGLSGQMHGSVFLDKNHQVIRPALLWNDQRTAAECDEIERRAGGRRKLIQMVANPALTGFTAPKILWLRNNEPRRFDRTRQVLLPKDYVRFRLTGEFATEVSDASGTLLLDVKRRKWSRRLLEQLELDPALLPEVYESEDVSGTLSKSSAKKLGLPEGVPVVGGGGDQAAGAVGNGIVRRGVISATMGTSGVVFAHSEGIETDPLGRVHTFCHAVRGQWHVMGVVLSAGGSLQWYRNQLGEAAMTAARRKKVDPYELLTAEAARAPAGSEGLYSLPYLTGERTPPADPNARGAWIGLSLLRDARLPGEHQGDEHPGPRNPDFRWWSPQPVLATDAGRHLRQQGGDHQRRRGAGLRSGVAGCCRDRGLQGRRRGLQRHDPSGRLDTGPPTHTSTIQSLLPPVRTALPVTERRLRTDCRIGGLKPVPACLSCSSPNPTSNP